MSKKDPTKRKQQILTAALEVSRDSNYMEITKKSVALKAGVSMGLVNVYFGTMEKLRKEIMRAAVKREIYPIILQGLIRKDRYALKANEELKNHAYKSLLG